jgi:hypothetical protein
MSGLDHSAIQLEHKYLIVIKVINQTIVSKNTKTNNQRRFEAIANVLHGVNDCRNSSVTKLRN